LKGDSRRGFTANAKNVVLKKKIKWNLTGKANKLALRWEKMLKKNETTLFWGEEPCNKRMFGHTGPFLNEGEDSEAVSKRKD